MKKLTFILFILAAILATGCSAGSSDEMGAASDWSGGGAADGSYTSTGTGTSEGSGGGSPADPPPPDGEESKGQGPKAGTLTAGDWDDNLNFDWFGEYRDGFLGNDVSIPRVDVSDRKVIIVTNGDGEPVSNATVKIHEDGTELLSAPTASDGRLLFFPSHDGAAEPAKITITVAAPEGQQLEPVTVDAPKGDEWHIQLAGAVKAAPQALDLAFVLDVTGSMQDELSYLQAEIAGIADEIVQNFGDISVRYGLVVYRDHGSKFVTKSFDFSDLATFKTSLDEFSAGGGGDIPEAMDEALLDMHELSWRTGNVARMAFLVADAPPHAEDGQEVLDLADKARVRGIKIYPIAASGVEEHAEYYLRQSAQLTMGRYLFLTDDSGVGNSHAKPHIPCYQVQYLNVLMNRMIASELAGFRVKAKADDVIKYVGNPNADGVCKLDRGDEVKY